MDLSIISLALMVKLLLRLLIADWAVSSSIGTKWVRDLGRLLVWLPYC